jgi:hypothetical protein
MVNGALCFFIRLVNSPALALKTPTITVSSANSFHRLTILLMRILQNGQDENLKKVSITRLPFISDILNVVPSIAGKSRFGALSPTVSMGMIGGSKIRT